MFSLASLDNLIRRASLRFAWILFLWKCTLFAISIAPGEMDPMFWIRDEMDTGGAGCVMHYKFGQSDHKWKSFDITCTSKLLTSGHFWVRLETIINTVFIQILVFNRLRSCIYTLHAYTLYRYIARISHVHTCTGTELSKHSALLIRIWLPLTIHVTLRL